MLLCLCVCMIVYCGSLTLKVHVRSGTTPNTLEHRLVWCPMVEEDDDVLLLAVSHGETVRFAISYSSTLVPCFRERCTMLQS